MKKESLYIATGVCSSCNKSDWAIGSSIVDAGLLLRHQHGRDHLWYGEVTIKPITKARAEAMERSRL